MKKILLTLFLPLSIFAQNATDTLSVINAINSNIYSNTNHSITGDILNKTLKTIARSSANKTSNIATDSTDGVMTASDHRSLSGNVNPVPVKFAKAATTASITFTYSTNTLTAVSNGRLANQDGVTLGLGDELLVKNNGVNNGLYVIYDTGTVSTPAKMYRDSLYRTTAEIYPSQINVLSGLTNGTRYFNQTTVNPTIGVDSLVFAASAAPTTPAYPVSFVSVAATTSLTATLTYSNGTNPTYPAYLATYQATTNGVFPTLQGVAPYNGMKVLLTAQIDSTKNGTYALTNKGSSTSKYSLQRVDYSVSMLYPRLWELTEGLNKGAIYQQNNKTLTNAGIGVSNNLSFSKINLESTSITAGYGITSTGSAPSYTISTNYTAAVITTPSTSTLSAAAPSNILVTGTSTGTVTLPVGTTLFKEYVYYINNNSTGNVTVNKGDGTLLTTMAGGSYIKFILTDSSTTAGTWDYHAQLPSNATFGSGGMNITGSLTATSTFTATNVPLDNNVTAIAFNFYEGGGLLAPGAKNYVVSMPYGGTITGYTLWSTSGGTALNSSTVMDIWKTTTGTLPTVSNTIFSGNNPTLTSASYTTSSALSISVATGDVIIVAITSNTAATDLNFILNITKN